MTTFGHMQGLQIAAAAFLRRAAFVLWNSWKAARGILRVDETRASSHAASTPRRRRRPCLPRDRSRCAPPFQTARAAHTRISLRAEPRHFPSASLRKPFPSAVDSLILVRCTNSRKLRSLQTLASSFSVSSSSGISPQAEGGDKVTHKIDVLQ